MRGYATWRHRIADQPHKWGSGNRRFIFPWPISDSESFVNIPCSALFKYSSRHLQNHPRIVWRLVLRDESSLIWHPIISLEWHNWLRSFYHSCPVPLIARSGLTFNSTERSRSFPKRPFEGVMLQPGHNIDLQSNFEGLCGHALVST